MKLIEFAMKFGKKISGSNLQKLGNTSFVNKYIENIRKNIIRMERNHLVELNKIKVNSPVINIATAIGL